MAAKKKAASGKRSEATPVRGKPIEPGQVLNPEGRNQYSYRRDNEETITRVLRGSRPEGIREAVRKTVPESSHVLLDSLLDELGERPTTGEVMGVLTVVHALSWDDQRHVAEVLKRIWPATATGTEEDPIHTTPSGIDLSGETPETLRAALKRLGG